MQRRDVLKAFVGVAGLGFAAMSPSANGANVHAAPAKKESETMQYDNSKFYKNGVFQQDAAFEAYFEMFEKELFADRFASQKRELLGRGLRARRLRESRDGRYFLLQR